MSGKAVTAMLAVLSIFCLLMVAVMWPGSASAQEMKCAPRAVVTQFLLDRHQEVQAARGSIDDKTIMELFISPAGSWSVLITNERSVSCILSGGTEGFEFVAPEAPRQGRGT